ncbi:MAG TPA: MotA/TolQ/ExbB proton channel family protein [Calditrichia bacterium]|nr:MotA/TolQ/ExbB proton channel family protein [Calditrichota bacterium]HQU72507.1 MotA/TolQ/ExbB proton channel family protein [Calditrichia bacterium]HQV30904.1 MotA/TolQ/ExbB proton channel family protein [Calditrichia bacterium]
MRLLNSTAILLGIAVLAVATRIMAPGNLAWWNGVGLIFVLSGTLSALIFSYSLGEILRVFRIAVIVMGKKPITLDRYVSDIFELSIRVRREGLLKSQEEIEALEDPFLKDGLNMLVDGYTSAETRWILEQRSRHQHLREMLEARMFRSMSRYAPAFGGLAALLSLSFQAQAAGPFAALTPMFGPALLPLGYGLLLSHLVFIPVAERLERRAELRNQLMQLIVEGVVMINDSWHPAKTREALDSFLPAGQRKNAAESYT